MFESCPVDLTKMTKKERDEFFDDCLTPGEIRCLFDENGNYKGIPDDNQFSIIFWRMFLVLIFISSYILLR